MNVKDVFLTGTESFKVYMERMCVLWNIENWVALG